MPLDKTTSRSLPAFPIPAEKPDEARKTASLTDLRGELRTPDGVHPFHLTEAEELPSAGVSTHGNRNSGAQLSDYHAELVSVPASVQGESSNVRPSDGTSQVTGLAQPLPSVPPGASTTDTLVQTVDEPLEEANRLKPTSTSELMEPAVAEKPKTGKKKAKQTHGAQPASAKAGSKGTSPQVSSELIAEVKSLVTAATLEQLKATGGNLMKLAGIDESPHKDALGSNDQLSQVFKFTYDKLSKGGGNFPVDFAYKLMAEFEDRARKLKGQKVASASAMKSASVSKVKSAGKLTLEQTPGLQDMFLARAINQLITKELHKLDPLVGDEGCQLRTPFTLDMYELVQEQLKTSPFQSTAGQLVREYRQATGEEQAAAIARMKELEKMRTHKDPQYDTAVSEFINSDALKASMAAKSGSYQEMFTHLMTAIDKSWPKAREYLEHLESETLSWGHGVDPFGVEVMNFKDPILPDKILGKRKVAQAEYSKSYVVKALSDLLQAKGINVEAKNVVAGYSKKGEEERLFNVPSSNPESILSMLLYAIQLCTASKSVNNRDLPLVQAWESVRSLVPMMLAKERPIIVNLKRVVATGPEVEPEYTSDFCESLFYEPTEDGYKYQPDPSPAQQEQGGVVVSGFAMLRPGDEKLKAGGLKVSPWVHEEDPKMFKEGFTSVDFPKLFFLGAIKHPPLDVGTAGAKALALSPEESAQCTNSTKTRDFGRNPENSFPYAEALHTKALENLGQAGMTEAGQKWLTPDYQLTDEAKHLVFPDQCPVDVTGSRPEAKMNIAEEFQLLLRLAEAANLESVRYSMESKDYPGEVLRVANKTLPFSIQHIHASTFKHENAMNEHYAESSKGIKAGRRQKISDLDRHDPY